MPLAAVVVLLCSAWPVAAQVVFVEFQAGRVRLIAENAPVSRILAEWARVGGTRIVHGERVPGAPVTLQLLDVSEQQALEVVLRGAAGYIVSARQSAAPSGSVFDRILVLPTTTRAPSAASLPPPVAGRARQAPVESDDRANDAPEVTERPVNPVSRFPRVVEPQDDAAEAPPSDPSGAPAEDAGPGEAPEAVTPSNPFFASPTPGTAQPGAITPAPRRAPRADR